MNIKLLEQLIPKELFEQLQEALKEKETSLVLFDTKTGDWIPKNKFDEERSKQKALADEIATLKATVTDLQGKAGEGDSLREKVSQLTNDLASKDGEISSMRKEYHIKSAIQQSGARDSDIVFKLIDAAKVEEKDGKYTGLDEQLKELTTSKAFLFESKEVPPRGGFNGGRGSEENPQIFKNSDVNSAIRQAAGH